MEDITIRNKNSEEFNQNEAVNVLKLSYDTALVRKEGVWFLICHLQVRGSPKHKHSTIS